MTLTRLAPSGPFQTIEGGAVPVLPNWLFVDGDSAATTHDGSIGAPFLTIQAALNAIAASVGHFSWVVQVTPQAAGVYAEDLSIPGGHAIELIFGGQDQQTNNGASGNHTWTLAPGETRNRLVVRNALLGSVASVNVPNNPATLELWDCDVTSGLNVPNVNTAIHGNGNGQAVVVIAAGDLFVEGMRLQGPLSSLTFDAFDCVIEAAGETWNFGLALAISFKACRFETNPVFTFLDAASVSFDDYSWSTYAEQGGTAVIPVAQTFIDSSAWCITSEAIGSFAVPAAGPGTTQVVTKNVAELVDGVVDLSRITGIVPTWRFGTGPTIPGIGLVGAWLSDAITGEVSVQFFTSAEYAGGNEAVSLGILQRKAPS